MYLSDVLKLFAVNVATSTETRWANVRYPALVAMRTYKRESAYKKLVEDLRFNDFLTKTRPYEFVCLLRRFNLRLTNKDLSSVLDTPYQKLYGWLTRLYFTCNSLEELLSKVDETSDRSLSSYIPKKNLSEGFTQRSFIRYVVRKDFTIQNSSRIHISTKRVELHAGTIHHK